MKRILLAALCLLGAPLSFAQAPNSWSNEDYTFYAGDFNGDGFTDILYIGRNASLPSGILLSDGTAPTIAGQTWASNYLGVPWSSDAYTVVVGDFNGDGKTDILLQSNLPGDSYLILTDSSGKISAISQTIPQWAMGLDWSAQGHHLVVGDFNGDGHADLFLQPVVPGDASALIYADVNGQFTSTAPTQIWADGYLGYNWSVEDANVFAGDFNGDGRADLLIQAQPINSGDANESTAFQYPPNMNGVVLAQSGAQPFTLTGVQAWSRTAFGVDWSPVNNNLVIADFNGDGRSDVLLQPVESDGAAKLLFGNATGPIFSSATGSLASDTVISADQAVLVAGKFGGGSAAGLLIQAATREGTTSIARSITSGIHGGAIILPTLTASSVPAPGMGPAPPPGAVSTPLPGGPLALAATVAPTSAGRTAGQFSVTPTGAASYNIPLWTPPGARGIEPHLALHYTSGGADGPMGPGWSLTGLSAIVRCGKTWASTSGSPAGVTLTTSDDICLDGNRLRLTTGTQLMTGSQYGTEIANFSLIVASGTTGAPATSFTVSGKDGRYYDYGTTADSQIMASGATTPYAWALSKVRDRQGNNMTFTYTTGASAMTLAKIQYTATPGTSNTAPYEVDFNYVSRVGSTIINAYVAGSAVTRTQQLDNVNVLASGVSVRKYQLGYAASGTTNRPMLQTVQECGGSAGTDCLRPTTITYQSGSAGWSTTATSTGLTGQYGFFAVDLNGDGIPDALYGKLSGTNIVWYARIATLTGYGAEISTGATTSTASGSQQLVIGNFDGTGQAEFLAPSGSPATLYAYRYNSTTSTFTSNNTTAASGSAQFTLDWDGDGLPDLVYVFSNDVTVLHNTTVAGGAITFASTSQTVFTSTFELILTNPVVGVDFNGDGRSDLLVRTFHTCCKGNAVFQDYTLLSNGFSAAPTQIDLNGAIDNETENGGSATVVVGDWNGDGCTDVITPKAVFISDCAGNFTSFLTNIPILSGTLPFPYPIQLADVDGDGRMDLLYPDPTTNNWFVLRSTGTSAAPGVTTGIAYAASKSLGTIDRDSDGQPDLLLIDSGAGYAVSWYPHNAARTPPDLAITLADGFNIAFNPTYVPISHANYTKYSDAVFPEMDFEGPMYVVDQFSASDGIGGTYTNDFYYWGARLHLQGRGFEGFYATRQHDSRTGFYVTQNYERSFPYTGSAYIQQTLASDQATYIHYKQDTLTYQSGPNCLKCYFPFVQTSTEYNFEPTGTKAGNNTSSISTTVTNYTYDVYGNLTDTKVTITDTDSRAPASPFNGQSWITEIKNTITNDATNWCLGRPTTTTTTKTNPGPAAQTRTVNHTIDYVNCRATVETVEPNDTHLKVTTNFGFDACGNTSSVSVVGLDQSGAPMTARPTTTSYGTRCQLPESVTNAYSQTTHTGYRYDLALPSSTTDANGIRTAAWLYDDFGRKTSETRADGTSTTYSYADCVSTSCWGSAILRFRVVTLVFNSAGTQLRETEQFYDGLERLSAVEGNRATGVWTIVQNVFDSLGRKTEVTLPFSTTDNGYHIYGYDLLNRVTSDTLYTGSNVVYRTIGMTYQGQTSIVQDPNGNKTTKITDVAGRIRRVTDDATHAAAASTDYTFDPFGNLTTIVDAINATSTYSYNIRGFKTGSSDADAGAWTFTPDSLNELVSQHDANGNVTSFGYDLLGRMTSRTEPENPTTPTTWAYGTSATAHEIGRIKTVSKPDSPNPYGESYTYDTLGRPQTITYTEDAANYPFTYAYNNEGTVDTITYPVSTAGFQFVLKNVYDNWGFLSATKDNAAGTVFWSLGSANDSSLPTSETLGNGVTVSSTYTPWTNEVSSRAEGTGTSTNNLQNLSYDWDLAGNMHDRIDHRQSLTELFSYDSMNRLLGSTLTVGTNAPVTNLTLTYDAAGNIATKSDVGSAAYTYDTVHKHAVKTAGTWTMAYDADGNMTSRAGGALTWASYNLPLTVAYQSNTTQFSYNADHKRYKQVANYAGVTETTHYIGGLLEIMTRGTGPTEYRHQIPAGSNGVVYTRRTDGTMSTYYATSDHLGSSDLVMDSTATVLTRQSFTPFGARRGSNWQGTPAPSDYTAFGNTTRKGFTGHEMLDSVNLVHMNGRVYDPYLGRVLSADSVIQNLGASESVNPYAYAWNDPLKYTDPSGHSLLGDIVGLLVSIAAIALMQPEVLAFEAQMTVETAMVAGFAGGFVGAAISTGQLSAAFEAGVIGLITAGATAGIVQAASAGNWDVGEVVVAHAGVGCIAATMAEGNCGKGALSAAFAIAAQPMIIKFGSLGMWSAAPEAAEAGLIGGEAAKIVGGKFDDGFSVAAVQYLVSFSPSDERQTGTPEQQIVRVTEGLVVDVYAAMVGQLGGVYAFFQDLGQSGKDLAGGEFGSLLKDLGSTLYDIAVPHYGYYGGSGWGTRQFPNGVPAPVNQQDFAGYTHDGACTPGCTAQANAGWLYNSYNVNPNFLPAGPLGDLYKLIGTVPFEIASKPWQGH